MAKRNEGGKPVASVSNGDGKKKAKSGKPRKITSSMMKAKTASLTTSLGHAGTIEGSGGNFYSPELSTDFLELPQSLHEQWNYYRFFYRSEPFVGQAVDLHTELPLSKIRIGIPEPRPGSSRHSVLHPMGKEHRIASSLVGHRSRTEPDWRSLHLDGRSRRRYAP